MKVNRIISVLSALLLSVPLLSCEKKAEVKKSVLDFEVKKIITIYPVSLSQYKGKVVLMVNTATECGFTPQYVKLQDLYIKYRDKGFEILAFPSNSFEQEPRTDEEIAKFCTDNFMVSFPMFTKIDVKGPNIVPIYEFLTNPQANPKFPGEITWNFEKFLIDRNGEIIGRFEPKMEPDDPTIVAAIEKAL